MYKINEVAQLTGITVRTLHYYDEIGLFKPREITDVGYRLYDESSLEVLQQILFFRELDFQLNEIKAIMASPTFDETEALNKHKELLIEKKDRLDKLITLVDKTLNGEKNMSFNEFDMAEIEANKQKYATEVKARWGETDAYNQSKTKTESYNEKQWGKLNEESTEILNAFGMKRNLPADCAEVQELVGRWQRYISANFYDCTKEILSGLASIYTGDERFKENIDKNGKGTAEFIAKAIAIYTL